MIAGKKLFLSRLVRDLRLLYLFPNGRRWKRECLGCVGPLIMRAALAVAAGSGDRVNGWEAGLRDGLGYIHDLLEFLAVWGRAGTIPSCDATRKNACYGASVKVGESRC